MIVEAALSSSGVLLDESSSGCFSCSGKRNNIIKYTNIVLFEERESQHFLVKYVNRSSSVATLSQKIVHITSKETQIDQHDRRESQDELYPERAATALNSGSESVEQLVNQRSFAACYEPTSRKPLLVLLNPKSGTSNSRKYYEEHAAPVFAAAGLKTKIIITKYRGEAIDIASQLQFADHDTIVCVSGDGLPHEVLNGLAKREDGVKALQHFAIGQLPGGSGNAMCHSLNNGTADWTVAALGIVKGTPEPHDIMSISQLGNSAEDLPSLYYSFLSQSYGIVAECDLGTEDMRWMGGARFTVGIILKVVAGNTYPCEIAYHEVSPTNQTPLLQENASLVPTLAVTDPIPTNWRTERHDKLSMFYVGKMQYMSSDALVFPHAEPLDGAMDMLLWDTSIGAMKAMSLLMKFEKGSHVPSVPFYKKVDAYRLTPLKDNYMDIDGESYPRAPIQVSIVPGVARLVTPTFF